MNNHEEEELFCYVGAWLGRRGLVADMMLP